MTTAAPPATMRVAQYLRVSIDKDGRSRSTDEQQLDNERAILDNERDGWALVETYRDDNRSASRYARRSREDFTRLLADLERGSFDVLVLWESSRGSRRVSEWCRLIELCQEHGVRVFVTSHGRTYDPANSRDERSLLEDAVDSQYESGKVSTRVKRNAAANAKAGKPHGRIPYGYERVYDPHTKAFREQRERPNEGAVVRYIFASVAKGESLRAVTAELNRRARLPFGHYGPQTADAPSATGAPWSSQTVRQVALSPTYIAKRTHHGVVTDGVWPALVAEDTFYAVARILSDPARLTARPGKAKHLLSMIATCGAHRTDGTVCGNPMAVTYRFSDGRRATYSCKGQNHVRIDQEDLDDYVTRRVRAYLGQPAVWERLTAGGDDAGAVAARGVLAGLRARLDEHYAEAAAGRISAGALAAIEPRILDEIEQATARVEQASTPPALRSLLDGPGDVAARWAAAPMPARREVIRALADIAVLRSPSRGHRVDPQDRVTLEWRDNG